MAYFNVSRLLFDELAYPRDEKALTEAVSGMLSHGGPLTPLLVDNDLRVVGNAQFYHAARDLGLKAVFGQRLTSYKENPTFPDRFSVEISSRCNYRCVMCPRTALTRETGDMEPALFRRIMDEIAENGASMVDLYRLGESILHPQFMSFLDYINGLKPPITTSLYTNGGALTTDLLKAIMCSSITIFGISLNANDPETYKTVTGGKGDFYKVRDRILDALRFREGRKPFFGVQFIEQECTRDSLQEFIDHYIDHVDFIESSMLEDFGGQLTQNIQYILDHNLSQNNIGMRPPCQRSIWGRCRIYSNGDVVPCICDINAIYLNMGNVNHQSITDIFNSKKWNDFRMMHRNGEASSHPLCGPCRDWAIYTDCNKKQKVHL